MNSGTADATLRVNKQIDQICDRFEDCWQTGVQPQIDDYAADIDDSVRRSLLQELIILDVYYRRRARQTPTAADYQGRFQEIDAGWLIDNASLARAASMSRPPAATIKRTAAAK